MAQHPCLLKVGQVWQCRDQSWTATITHDMGTTDPRHCAIQASVVKRDSSGARVRSNSYYYVSTNSDAKWYYVHGPQDLDPCDLTYLLYDPNGQT